MIKVFKWLWKMAYKNGQKDALFEITSMAQYHLQQAEITAMRDKYEPRHKDDDILSMRHFMKPDLSADQHQAIADALNQLARRLPPAEEPAMQEMMIEQQIMGPPPEINL